MRRQTIWAQTAESRSGCRHMERIQIAERVRENICSKADLLRSYDPLNANKRQESDSRFF
jgi:hypothetical protein